MKQKTLLLVILAGLFIPNTLVWGTQIPVPAAARRLVTAKTIYVEPMPDHLDQWIIQDLHAWGKYNISGNSQGVDLVVNARKPEKDLYTSRGIVPGTRRPPKTPPVLSLTIVDWVTGARLWRVDLLNKGPQKGQSPPPPGPRTEIDVRHLKPDQIAERCTNLLRHYVGNLEQTPAAGPR